MPASDQQLSEQLASRAGQRLVQLLREPLRRASWWLERQGDQLAHDFIVGELRRERPTDAVLSEEGHDDRSRLQADRVWIIDPLDGSWQFARGRPWAVHVALCENGEPVAGAVAVPAWGKTFVADPPERRVMSRAGAVRAVVGWSEQHTDGSLMSSALDAEVFVLGSAGVKAMAVVRGEADVYVFSGWLYEWDVCAPAAVAAAAGLHVSLLDGSPFTYNKANPGSHGIVVCRPELAGTVLDAYRSRSRRGSAW